MSRKPPFGETWRVAAASLNADPRVLPSSSGLPHSVALSKGGAVWVRRGSTEGQGRALSVTESSACRFCPYDGILSWHIAGGGRAGG